MATITDINGKVHRLEDVDKVTWVDRDGNTVFTSDYGDTVTYMQNGVEKTKTLTESRRLLQFMDGFAAGDYSYMPKTAADVVQGTALEMMTNSTGWLVAKAGAVLLGSVATANPVLGVSIGSLLANLGADAYMLKEAYSQDPNTFWSKYVSNIKDIARGADSEAEPNATGWRRWLSEINTGASYIGMGGKSAVYETWDDIIGSTPDYVSMNIVGNLTRAVAAGIGGAATYVIDQGLNDALREGTRIVGITNDVAGAVKIGGIYGAVSSISAYGFTKLALADRSIFKKMENVSPFLGSPIANGIEAMGAQLIYDAIQDVADPTEATKTTGDYGLNAAMAFGTGYLMSALPNTWAKFKFKDAENAAKNPSSQQGITVKEAVESKVVVEEAKPEIKTVKDDGLICVKIQYTDDGLIRGKIQYTAEQLEKFNKQRIPRQYREQARATEMGMIEELSQVNVEKLYKATGKRVERVSPETELIYLKRKMFNNFNALNADEKAGLIYRMGFESESAFLVETPLADLYSLNKTVGDIYNVPIYNPNMPVLSVQQNTDITSNALKMINHGMSPETAIYIAYCKIAKVAPDESEVSRILATIPETVRVFDESSSVMAKVRDFINANEKEAFDYVFTNYNKLYPRQTRRKPQGKRKSKVQIVQEAIEGVDVTEGAKNNKFKRK